MTQFRCLVKSFTVLIKWLYRRIDNFVISKIYSNVVSGSVVVGLAGETKSDLKWNQREEGWKVSKRVRNEEWCTEALPLVRKLWLKFGSRPQRISTPRVYHKTLLITGFRHKNSVLQVKENLYNGVISLY